MAPGDKFIRAESGLADCVHFGRGSDSAQIGMTKAESVCAAQDRADIPRRADVIHQDGSKNAFFLVVFFDHAFFISNGFG